MLLNAVHPLICDMMSEGICIELQMLYFMTDLK